MPIHLELSDDLIITNKEQLRELLQEIQTVAFHIPN